MESRGDLALYEYLYRCIRHDIAHGKVEPGQKLPSKRALAKQLGVSLITVEAAYDQLVAEGYIRASAAATTHATLRPPPRSRNREARSTEPRRRTPPRDASAIITPQTRTTCSFFRKRRGIWKTQSDIGHPTPTSPRPSPALRPALKTPRPMRRCS